jgi:sarcosine/dimethylglycine N-methyltransferase
MPDDIAAERDAYRAYFDAGVSELMSRMWRGNLHIGLFEHDEEPLEDAQCRLKDRIGRAFALPRGASIVEAACGVGTTAIFLAEVYGSLVHATNISEEQLREARARATRSGVAHMVTFATADYHDLPVGSASFDGWLCQEALLYAKDRSKVFSEAQRVVRPGGRLVFTDLTLSRDMAPADRETLARGIRAPYLWSAGEYRHFIDDLGLRVLDRTESTYCAELTFRAVAKNLAELEDEYVARLGATKYQETQARILSQYEAAREGHLGWCFYCVDLQGAAS